jgi:hypothetical protein
VDRRHFVLCAAPALGLPTLLSVGSKASPLTDLSGEQNVENQSAQSADQAAKDGRHMVDAPLSPDTKVTIERRGQIVLIGINRPQMLNKIDPDTFYGLATAYSFADRIGSKKLPLLGVRNTMTVMYRSTASE